jgi:hypothetical protein
VVVAQGPQARSGSWLWEWTMDAEDFNERRRQGVFRRWYHRLGQTDAARTRAYEAEFAKWIQRGQFAACLETKAEDDAAVNPDPGDRRRALRELFRGYSCVDEKGFDKLERDFSHRGKGFQFLVALAEFPCLLAVLKPIDF